MLWIITHKETYETPKGAIQTVHIERDDDTGIVLILERPTADDDMTKADMAALALAQGEIIDPNNID